MAPPFDFLHHTFLPLLKRMGAEVVAKLERPGFFPAGGGRIRITVDPAEKLQPIELTEDSNFRVSARAVSAELPGHIARRELTVVKSKFDLSDDQIEQVQLDKYGPGNALSVFVHSDQLTETFTGFGQKNVSAEKVSARAVKQARNYIQAAAPVGKYLADQQLIPMALAGAGCFRTSKPTNHTLTNVEVIKQFFNLEFKLSEKRENIWEVEV